MSLTTELSAEPRFEVVYHLQSVERNEWLRLKCRLAGGNPEIDSVTGVWRAANWYERETFDLFGISFRNHPDLRRIMLTEDFEGHPLRKDWVDPDFYNGLHVKPTPQMADRAMAGEKIGIGPFDVTPPNRHVEE